MVNLDAAEFSVQIPVRADLIQHSLFTLSKVGEKTAIIIFAPLWVLPLNERRGTSRRTKTFVAMGLFFLGQFYRGRRLWQLSESQPVRTDTTIDVLRRARR
jgi:hypothetical protein